MDFWQRKRFLIIEFLCYALLTFCVTYGFYRMGGFSISATSCFYSDAWILHCMATNFIETGTMSYMDEGPTLYQLWGYPLFISTIYRIFGDYDVRNVLLTQIILCSFMLPTLIVSLRGLIGKWRHLFAVFMLLDVHLWLYTTCMITEFWVWSMWAFALIFFSKAVLLDKPKYILLTFTFMAIAANMKPLPVYCAYFFLIAITVVAFPYVKRHAKFFLMGICLYTLALTPLLVRNYLATEEFPRYSTISSFGMWTYNVSYFKAEKYGLSYKDVRVELVEQMRQKLIARGANIEKIPREIALDRNKHIEALGLNEYEYAQLADEMIGEFLKENFFSYSWYHFKAAKNVFFVSNLSWLKLYFHFYEDLSYSGNSPSELLKILFKFDLKSFFLFIRFYEVIYVAFLLPFVLFAIYKSLRNNSKALSLSVFCASSFIMYVALVTGLNSWGRFRYIFMHMFVFCAICGMKIMYENYREYKENKRFSSFL